MDLKKGIYENFKNESNRQIIKNRSLIENKWPIIDSKTFGLNIEFLGYSSKILFPFSI